MTTRTIDETFVAGGTRFGTYDYWLEVGRHVCRGQKAHADYLCPKSGKAVFAEGQTSVRVPYLSTEPHWNLPPDDDFDSQDWIDFGDRDDA